MTERASFLWDTAGATVTVYIRGEIDHHTAVTVRNGIDAMLFENRPARMILDLSKVGFMDSSGLGLIMGRLSVMKSLGGTMTVRNPSRETEAILTLAGMERLIRIEYTEGVSSEAADALRKKAYEPPKMATASVVSLEGIGRSNRREHNGQARQRKSTRKGRSAKVPGDSA
ncbi:MAG: STAS domain-containing protein [Ruminococcaceae bacterium]|nr:STAS domain-containing protein [Oscillospiraceae bacterium]